MPQLAPDFDILDGSPEGEGKKEVPIDLRTQNAAGDNLANILFFKAVQQKQFATALNIRGAAVQQKVEILEAVQEHLRTASIKPRTLINPTEELVEHPDNSRAYQWADNSHRLRDALMLPDNIKEREKRKKFLEEKKNLCKVQKVDSIWPIINILKELERPGVSRRGNDSNIRLISLITQLNFAVVYNKLPLKMLHTIAEWIKDILLKKEINFGMVDEDGHTLLSKAIVLKLFPIAASILEAAKIKKAFTLLVSKELTEYGENFSVFRYLLKEFFLYKFHKPRLDEQNKQFLRFLWYFFCCKHSEHEREKSQTVCTILMNHIDNLLRYSGNLQEESIQLTKEYVELAESIPTAVIPDLTLLTLYGWANGVVVIEDTHQALQKEIPNGHPSYFILQVLERLKNHALFAYQKLDERRRVIHGANFNAKNSTEAEEARIFLQKMPTLPMSIALKAALLVFVVSVFAYALLAAASLSVAPSAIAMCLSGAYSVVGLLRRCKERGKMEYAFNTCRQFPSHS